MIDKKIPLRVEFDDDVNVAWIYLADEPPNGWRPGKTASVVLDINVDVDGRIMWLELLDAKSVLSHQFLKALTNE